MYVTRTAGNSTKFKRNDNDYPLTIFAQDATRHFTTHGLDTQFYIYNQGTGTVTNILENHADTTMSAVEKFISDGIQNNLFDSFAVESMLESGEWFLNSIHVSIRHSIQLSLGTTKIYGPIVWMSLIKECQTESLSRTDKIKTEFEGLTVLNTPGENVRDYVDKAMVLLDQLDKARDLPRNYLLTIGDALSACSVEEFRFHFINRRSLIESYLRETRGKSAIAIAGMPGEHFTYRSLLGEAKDKYLELEARGKWTGKGTKIADGPSAHVATLDDRFIAFEAKITGLVQNLQSKPKTSGTAGSSSGTGAAPGTPHWRNTPPPAGQPESMTRNGKKYYFCKKCGGKGRWNLTHETANHISKTAPAPEAPAASMASAFIPSFKDWTGVDE
jgi:hypothetical protein